MSTTTTTGTPDDNNNYLRCMVCGDTTPATFKAGLDPCKLCGGQLAYIATIPSHQLTPHPFTSVPVRVPPDINREQWRWWFAGQVFSANVQEHGRTMAASMSVSDADALLAELERTSP